MSRSVSLAKLQAFTFAFRFVAKKQGNSTFKERVVSVMLIKGYQILQSHNGWWLIKDETACVGLSSSKEDK